MPRHIISKQLGYSPPVPSLLNRLFCDGIKGYQFAIRFISCHFPVKAQKFDPLQLVTSFLMALVRMALFWLL
jgi:hypothetical protein